MRRIQLRRADHLLTEFDVYDLLRSGDKSHDQQLLPGDVIYIPPVGPQVAILGSVNEPGIFELKGDATIAAVMKDAGGLTILARSDKVVLERIEKYGKRRVEEFALDVPGLQREFRDGDILRLFPISPKFENAVTLRGNVAQPGRFVWHEGMRVSDLISSRDALLTRSHWNAQNHLTGNIPRKVLTRELGSTWDPLTGDLNADANALSDSKTGRDSADPQSLLNVDKTADAPTLTDDHWEQQNQLAESSYKDLAKEIGKTSAEINWDYASIERLDEHDLSTRLIAFNLGNAIDNPSSVDNRTLKSGDVLTVFSRKDLPLPIEKRATFITVGGEVNAPGVYRVNPGDSLRNVVERAGGLTSHSYLYASQLTRESTRQAEEEQLKQSVAQLQRELISRFAGATSLSATDALDQKTQFNSQRAEIAQLAGIRPTGRIVLDMKPDAASVGEIPEFPLEDGDSFYIPPRLGTVQVAGAVYNESAFRYQPHKRFAVSAMTTLQ
jgi:protein involved in polysaccharide export with SLBB domain